MKTPKIRGLGIVQDGFTRRWKATDEGHGGSAGTCGQACGREEPTGGGRMSHTNSRIITRLAIVLIMVTLTLVADGIRQSEAHQDSCHR